jgi:hypothetical protein
VQINVHQLTYNSLIMRNRKNNVKKPTSAHKDLHSLAKNPHDQGKTTELELVMATVKERRYKEYEEFGKFHTDRDIAEGHITISETERLEELEKLAMEEIMAKYVNYSTMASEEHLVKCRDAMEEIITKYVNYSTMISEERQVKQATIMVGEEEPVTKKAAKRACQRPAKRTTSATPTPETPAKTGDSSDDCNSDKDEDPAAKAALAKAAPAAAAAAGDGEETRPTAKEATAKPTEEGSNEDSVDINDEKAAKPAAIAAEEMDRSYNGNSESDDASTTKTAHAKPMNDDKPPMAVKSDKNEKPAAETDQTKPAPKAAAKKKEPSPHEESIDE